MCWMVICSRPFDQQITLKADLMIIVGATTMLSDEEDPPPAGSDPEPPDTKGPPTLKIVK